MDTSIAGAMTGMWGTKESKMMLITGAAINATKTRHVRRCAVDCALVKRQREAAVAAAKYHGQFLCTKPNALLHLPNKGLFGTCATIGTL